MIDFKLTIDDNGKPVITFRLQRDTDDLHQKTLKTFIQNEEAGGIQLNKKDERKSSYGGEWDDYEISTY